MFSLVLRRLAISIPLLVLVTMLVFGLTALLPGDPAQTLAGPTAPQERVDALREQLGLDDPIYVRYVDWLAGAVQGDLGRSLFTRRPVTTEIALRLPVTAALVTGAFIVALTVGVTLGLLAARIPGGLVDRFTTLVATLGVAVPHFVFGIFLIVVFAVWMGLLPITGYASIASVGFLGWVKFLILPSVALSGLMTADIARQLRSGMLETMDENFIRTARAKGLPEKVVVIRHGLRVAAAPAIAVTAVHGTRLFGGSVIVEEVFRIPGLGRLTVQAVLSRDLPLIFGIVPLTVLLAIGFTLLADLLLGYLNPRLRIETSNE